MTSLSSPPSPAAAGTAETLKMAISGSLGAALKRALATHKKVTATIVGTVVDGAGKTERRSAPVTVALTG